MHNDNTDDHLLHKTYKKVKNGIKVLPDEEYKKLHESKKEKFMP